MCVQWFHVQSECSAVVVVERPKNTCTVEPLNNVTFGASYSVHYREVSLVLSRKSQNYMYMYIVGICVQDVQSAI